MKSISLAAAVSLTGWSERTLWRRFADGSMTYEVKDGKALVPVHLVAHHTAIPLDTENLTIIYDADAGNAEAQNHLALILLESGKEKNAIYWLELSAKQGYSNAMHDLGRCYISGIGIKKNENIGMMWIAKAAASGHVISQEQMDAILDRFSGKIS